MPSAFGLGLTWRGAEEGVELLRDDWLDKTLLDIKKHITAVCYLLFFFLFFLQMKYLYSWFFEHNNWIYAARGSFIADRK